MDLWPKEEREEKNFVHEKLQEWQLQEYVDAFDRTIHYN